MDKSIENYIIKKLVKKHAHPVKNMILYLKQLVRFLKTTRNHLRVSEKPKVHSRVTQAIGS